MIDFREYGYRDIEHFQECKKIKDDINKYLVDRKVLKKQLINNIDIPIEKKELILGEFDKNNAELFSSENLEDKRIMFIDALIEKYPFLK